MEDKLTMKEMVQFFKDVKEKGLDMVINLNIPNKE